MWTVDWREREGEVEEARKRGQEKDTGRRKKGRTEEEGRMERRKPTPFAINYNM